MKSISIYTITRNQNIEQLQKLERQLSGRDYFLKMREWELESMKALTAELETCMEDVCTSFLLFVSDSETGKRI